jgi:hypothetical protein
VIDEINKISIESDAMEMVSWEAILDSIQREQCIICLGPGIFSNENQTLEEQLIDYLNPFASSLKIRIYEDGWIHYLPGHNVLLPWMKIKNFYSKSFPGAQRILDKLAQIPFHFYISTTPSRHIVQAIEIYPHRFDFYFKNKLFNTDSSIKPSKYFPLAYNILGDIEHRESLILTYDDYFMYIKSLFSGNSMSPKLKEAVREADNFIFLGLSFDKWYMHLFLRILEQHENKNQLKYAPNGYIPEKIQSLCEDQFNITFVPYGIENFVNTLYEKCHAQGILRQKISQELIFDANEIRSLIAFSEIDKVLEKLYQTLSIHRISLKNTFDDLISISAQYNSLERKWRLAHLSHDEYVRECAKVTSSLLEIVNEAERCLRIQ